MTEEIHLKVPTPFTDPKTSKIIHIAAILNSKRAPQHQNSTTHLNQAKVLNNNSDKSKEVDEIPDGNKEPISVLCHGVFAHKNFGFFPSLASNYPHSTLRFDFRGAGDSDGEFTLTNYEVKLSLQIPQYSHNT